MARALRGRPGLRAALVSVLAAAAAGIALLGRAPAEGDVGGGWVLAQVPAAAAPVSFRDPHPAGSRVCVLGPGPDAPAPRVLSEGFAAAGSPTVSPDGTEVLFSGKRRVEDDWSVFRVALRGGRVRRVTPPGINALHPGYLAGDRIVFSADAAGTRDPYDGGASFSLYTCAADGSELERITFNPGSDLEPTVLRDGRVLYSGWQPPGPDRPDGGWGLFTVRRDGTGIFPFWGSHAPERERDPRQLADGRVVFVASGDERGEAAPGGSRLRSVALRRPLHSLETWELPGFRSAHSAADGPDGSLLLTLVPEEPGSGSRTTAGLYSMAAGQSSARLVFDDPDRHELDAVWARPRVSPRGLVSDTQPGAATGTLLCLDARRTDRTDDDPVVSPAASVRIYRAEEGSGALPTQELVSEIRLASDGSFLAEVPADVPLRFETVDESGNVLLDSKGWVWVRPGEQRACIGCHEDRETAPSNRVPEALHRVSPPVSPPQIAIGGTR